MSVAVTGIVTLASHQLNNPFGYPAWPFAQSRHDRLTTAWVDLDDLGAACHRHAAAGQAADGTGNGCCQPVAADRGDGVAGGDDVADVSLGQEQAIGRRVDQAVAAMAENGPRLSAQRRRGARPLRARPSRSRPPRDSWLRRRSPDPGRWSAGPGTANPAGSFACASARQSARPRPRRQPPRRRARHGRTPPGGDRLRAPRRWHR